MKLDTNDFSLDEILSIEPMGELSTVDITVDDTHMFYLENGVYTHNSGLNAEVITMESISEAFNKCFVADFIFSVSRTIEHKNENTGRMFIAKNRFGPDGLVYPLNMDTSNVTIEVLEPTGETANDIVVRTAKEQKEVLAEKYKEKYKEFKDERKNKDVQ